MLTASIIIPTYNRPRDLGVAVRSIVRQTVPPLEILVLDDGDLGDLPFRREAAAQGIRYIHIKKKPEERGLTRSRNIGIERAAGDVLFFFDDDVKLFPDFLEKSLELFRKFPEISGMGGGEVLEKPASAFQKIEFLYDLCFCITGLKKGYFLPSSFSTNIGNPVLKTKFAVVEFLGGAAFSFRKEVFRSLRFSEQFQGYGLGEDKEFTYRASPDHILVTNPAARVYHFESPVMRYKKYEKGRAKVLSKYLFLTSCNVKNRFNGFCFCYALAGYLFKRVMIMLVTYDKGEVEHVKGIISGMREILDKRKEV